MTEWLDDLTRILGSQMSRREAIRLATGGLAGRYLTGGLAGSALGLLWPARAEARYAAAPCDPVFTGPNCNAVGTCNCPPTHFCCTTSGPCCITGDECCGANCCQPALAETCCGPSANGRFRCCDLDTHCCCSVPGTGGRQQRCRRKPGLRLAAYHPGPPSQIEIEAVDYEGEGLSKIRVVTVVNANVDIPDFPPGTSYVDVTATRIDPAKPARVVLEVCTPCGESGECCEEGDPVVTTLRILEGKSRVRDSFADIPAAEHYLTVENGRLGEYRLRVVVNGKVLNNLYLERKEVRTIDIASAMIEKQNVVTLVGYGAPGSTALIVISDVPSAKNAPKSSVSLPYVAWDESAWQPGADPHWGRGSRLEN